MSYLTLAELAAGLDTICQSPTDEGGLQMIIRRPRSGEREVLEEATLDLTHGLVGDFWDLFDQPDTQLNIMNARAIALIAGTRERWPLAGDQLYLDLDLSARNLPPGTCFSLGTAIIEVTAVPHTGCAKFKKRFGVDATRFVNSPVGREWNLRGINAKVRQPGVVRVGDVAKKL
jgi:hypothetical protein